MIPIVPYEERFAEAVKDLLVSLQEYLVEIDPKQIQALPGSYRERKAGWAHRRYHRSEGCG